MITLAILAGGKSRRMGQDKALTPFLGRPLIFQVLDRLATLAEEMIVVAPASGEFLSLGPRIVPDLLPARGPLGGLYTALFSASHPVVIVVGCDMPFVSADLLVYEGDILSSENMDAVIPSSDKDPEPLHGIYRRDACLPAVQESLDRGEGRMILWFPQAKVRVLTPEETKPFDPRRLVFFNVNTPDELSQAERWAGEDGGGTPKINAILPV